MKSMKSKIIVSIIMSVITLVMLCIAVTLAWFSVTATDNYKMTIKANSMLVLKFESGIVVSPESGKLYPAVEKENAIANNMRFPRDLTKEHEMLASTANEVEYNSTLDVYLGSEENEEGAVFAKPQDIVMGLSLTIVTKDGLTFEIYERSEIEQIVNFQFFMKTATANVDPESDTVVYIPDTEDYAEVKLSEPYTYEVDKRIYLKLIVSLSQPQGLLDPELRDAKVMFNINVRANDVNKE